MSKRTWGGAEAEGVAEEDVDEAEEEEREEVIVVGETIVETRVAPREVMVVVRATELVNVVFWAATRARRMPKAARRPATRRIGREEEGSRGVGWERKYCLYISPSVASRQLDRPQSRRPTLSHY